MPGSKGREDVSHFSELSFLTNPEIIFLLSFFHGHNIILSSISSAGEL